MYDIIGDIHGFADELEHLLLKLAYTKKSGTYKHPERKVLFLGDFIDRGPQIRQVLHIVRKMVDAGNAIAIMGNHEYNALLFNMPQEHGGYMRTHSIKNIIQHYEMIKQFQSNEQEYRDYVKWFKTLPLYFETEHFRAVHACWDNEHIALLKQKLSNACLTDELIYQYINKETQLNSALEDTLKGKEINMPNGLTFTDKDGHIRHELRIKWWKNPKTATYRNISFRDIKELPERPVEKTLLKNYYTENEKPVFFGHYWMKGKPHLIRENICCLDFSVAKGGYLTAYRMDDEQVLTADKLVFV